MSHTSVKILAVFTCAGCGGQFTESHCCPSMPWGNTAPAPQFIVVGSAAVAALGTREGTE